MFLQPFFCFLEQGAGQFAGENGFLQPDATGRQQPGGGLGKSDAQLKSAAWR